jgi:hypothetical protein
MRHPRSLRWPAYFVCLMALAMSGYLAFAPSGCSSTNPVMRVAEPTGRILADCGKATVKDLGPRILDDVASALITADYSNGLRDVATGVAENLKVQGQPRAVEAAWEIVKCAVAEVRDQASTHLGYGHMDAATADREVVKRVHADQWLGSH